MLSYPLYWRGHNPTGDSPWPVLTLEPGICWLGCAMDNLAAMAGVSIHGDIGSMATEVLPHGGDTDGDQEKQSKALLPGSGRDAMAHSAASSQNSLNGEGPGDPAQRTPTRPGCSRLQWAEV